MTNHSAKQLNLGDDSLKRNLFFHGKAGGLQGLFSSFFCQVKRFPLYSEVAIGNRCVSVNHHYLFHSSDLANTTYSAPFEMLVFRNVRFDALDGIGNIAPFSQARQFPFERPFGVSGFDDSFCVCIRRIPLFNHHARRARGQISLRIFLKGHNWSFDAGISCIWRHEQQVFNVNSSDPARLSLSLRRIFRRFQVHSIALLGYYPQGLGQLFPPRSPPPRSETRISVDHEVADLYDFDLAETVSSFSPLSRARGLPPQYFDPDFSVALEKSFC